MPFGQIWTLHAAVHKMNDGEVLQDERRGRTCMGVVGIDEQDWIPAGIFADRASRKSRHRLGTESAESRVSDRRREVIE
jgi:hypothetical protein